MNRGTICHLWFYDAAYEPYIAQAKKLNALVGKGQTFKSIFLTSGAEAVENAIKIARGYSNRSGVIAFPRWLPRPDHA